MSVLLVSILFSPNNSVMKLSILLKKNALTLNGAPKKMILTYLLHMKCIHIVSMMQTGLYFIIVNFFQSK